MASSNLTPRLENPDWRQSGLLYYRLSHYFRAQFGCRVRKVSVDAGFDCPNRDGSRGTGGCIFCDPASFSPGRRLAHLAVAEQVAAAIEARKRRRSSDRFIVYFQPATNTYGPVSRLQEVYEEALGHPAVVGLIVGTRPDCVDDDVLDLLADLAGRTWLRVEFGLQSVHDRTLDRLNRGHRYHAFLDAHQRSRRRGLRIGAHVILGLPGESRDDMMVTAEELARLKIDAVKLHNLHAVKNTRLAAMVAAGQLQLPEFEQYVGWAVDFLERLPAECVVDRLSGDAAPSYFVGPSWCQDKAAVREAIEAEFRRRGSWQGAKFER